MKVQIERIKALAKEKGISITHICEKIGMGRGYFNDIKKSNGGDIPIERLEVITNILGTTVEYLSGESDKKEKAPTSSESSNIVFLENGKVFMIPLFESVSAGFGAGANDSVIDYMPCFISNPADAAEYICIRVTGDSMFPKIENGDIIQVHKQTSVDSGSLAVVLLDGDEGLVKKVIYGDDWIELHSINPMYPVQRFEGPDVLRLRVVGLVKKIIKEV